MNKRFSCFNSQKVSPCKIKSHSFINGSGEILFSSFPIDKYTKQTLLSMILNEDFYEDDIISKIYSIKYKVNDSRPLLEKELNRRKQPNFSSQRDFENFLSKYQTYDVICFDSSHNQICRYNNLSEDVLLTTFSYSIKESIVNNYNPVGSVSEIFIDDIETVEQQSIHNSNNFSELKQFISENVKTERN